MFLLIKNHLISLLNINGTWSANYQPIKIRKYDSKNKFSQLFVALDEETWTNWKIWYGGPIFQITDFVIKLFLSLLYHFAKVQ